jgi:hypothetical protein
MPTTVQDDVRRAVARCIPRGEILRTGEIATQIAAIHKGEGVSTKTIADLLLQAGIAAGVPIEIETPKKASVQR